MSQPTSATQENDDAVQVRPGPRTMRAFYQVLANTAVANGRSPI